MIRTRLALVAAGLVPLAAPAAVGSQVVPSAHHDFHVIEVVDGLEVPWSIAFLPSGEMLVTERPGRLRVVRDGRLLPNAVPGLPEVFARGQGGLLDVVPHPDFASNRLLYISYSKPQGGDQSTTAIIRGRFENDRLTNVEEIFEANSRGRGHYGSRIAFDDDGYMFFTVGDRQAPSTGDLERHPAQDLSNHHGTVNRLHDDGRVPSDNPFVGRSGAEPSIWSYGHRNPQGLAIDPSSGDLWITEHGPQGGDELNRVLPGRNYGWPVVGYGVNYGEGTPIHEAVRRDDMESPEHFWVPSIGTSGLMVYTGDRFPGWRGDLLAGGLSGERVDRIVVDGGEAAGSETLLRGIGRIRDVRQGPDGYVYVAVEAREGGRTPIVRLEPAGRE